jgi:hypothetical protein
MKVLRSTGMWPRIMLRILEKLFQGINKGAIVGGYFCALISEMKRLPCAYPYAPHKR